MEIWLTEKTAAQKSTDWLCSQLVDFLQRALHQDVFVFNQITLA